MKPRSQSSVSSQDRLKKFDEKKALTSVSSTQNSPQLSVRFDPTSWAKERQLKIEQSKNYRKTFGYASSNTQKKQRHEKASQLSNCKNYIANMQKSHNYNKERKFNNKNTFSPKYKNKQKLVYHLSKSPSENENNTNASSCTQNEIYTSKNNSKTDTLCKNKNHIQHYHLKKNKKINIENKYTHTIEKSKEIQTIDAKLNALQTFLKAAKSKKSAKKMKEITI
ncbi:hypothetical protein RFI_11383 [Reticulomyxa filosa]|uniref:Uncharacterized protein n=1 Tax=Reticulomyxa filosa TaxID=46433 RepID=X6NHF0_RETFI|nr:hypothetical protein RFI_11383 [Reticulomyxa filosa]|eukprot:ETO25750.1 hypothetical protein RFI_11383 [Reticulomyxa filosa]